MLGCHTAFSIGREVLTASAQVGVTAKLRGHSRHDGSDSNEDSLEKHDCEGNE